MEKSVSAHKGNYLKITGFAKALLISPIPSLHLHLKYAIILALY